MFYALGAVVALVGLGECAYAMIHQTDYDSELDQISIQIALLKIAQVSQRRSEALKLGGLITNYVNHFVPAGAPRDLFTIGMMYHIAGLEDP